MVGSRTPRTNVETTVPVDVITAEEIARSGRTETGRILNNLSASYLSVPQTISDGTDHVDPASLRGLGPDQVLVLINGKRRHRSALLNINGTFGRGTVGTDLNAIASGSIKRIEILRDGAASQYGSDAIAGVINIVTKDTTDVVDISSEAGITASRDGAQLKGSANYGFKIGQKGFLNITGEFLERDATNRSGTYTGPVYSNDMAVDDMMLAAKGLTRKDFGMRIGESAVTAGMGEYNLELPFSDNAMFYSFGDLSHRRGDAGGFYRYPVQESQNVPEFYPNGFLPLILPTMDDQAYTVGIRRKGDWDVDASITHGTSAFKFDIDNSVNASLGTASPTTFDAGTLESTETTVNLDLLHKLDQKQVKSIALVLGSELRVENYQIHAGDEASYSAGTATNADGSPKLPGAQVFPGFQPSNEVDRTRDSIGVYGGVESELTKKVALDADARYEHYSDFGQSLIGKVAGRVTVADGLALRGAVSTGFRAPSLQQLWFSNVATQFLPDATGALQPTQVLTSNNASPVTRAFGIPKLHEEKSTNLSGGVAWRPLDNLSLTADGYFIRIKDRIVLTSQFANTNATVADILAPFPAVSQAQFFANAVDTDTTGRRCRRRLGHGRRRRHVDADRRRELLEDRRSPRELARSRSCRSSAPIRRSCARSSSAATRKTDSKIRCRIRRASRRALLDRRDLRARARRLLRRRSTTKRITRRTTKPLGRSCCSTSISGTRRRRRCRSASAPTTFSTRSPIVRPRTRTSASGASSTAATSANSA